MFGFNLLTLMTVGILLMPIGALGVIIRAVLALLKKERSAEYFFKAGIVLIAAGIICLALVYAIGGVGMFNA